MKTIIAGTRRAFTRTQVDSFLNRFQGHPITEVVCGGAIGPDTFGGEWAHRRKTPIKYFFPDWAAYGIGAGFKRNRQMAAYGEALIAFWDGESSGTRNMITEAQRRGLIVTVVDQQLRSETEDWSHLKPTSQLL